MFLTDYNLQIEYNFLNFRTNNGIYETTWTPYLFGGIGQYKLINGAYASTTTINYKPQQSPNIIIPFGIGIKKIFFGKLNVGFRVWLSDFMVKVRSKR